MLRDMELRDIPARDIVLGDLVLTCGCEGRKHDTHWECLEACGITELAPIIKVQRIG